MYVCVHADANNLPKCDAEEDDCHLWSDARQREERVHRVGHATTVLVCNHLRGPLDVLDHVVVEAHLPDHLMESVLLHCEH